MLTRYSESLDGVGTPDISKVVVVGLGGVASEEDLLGPWIRYPAIQARCRRLEGSREVARIIVPRELSKRLKILIMDTGDKGPNIHWAHAEHIVVTDNK